MKVLTYQEALKIAKNYLLNINNGFEQENYMILEEETIEKQYGWIFFYQSEDFVLTKDPIYLLAGNSPFLVNKFTHKIVNFGTVNDISFYISEYERNFL